MTEATSMGDRYLGLIEKIVETTLKGNIRSKEQVYRMLVRDVSPGTGEIFERCLSERLTKTQEQFNQETDELKQAKVSRILRALQTIAGEWERWQQENRATEAIAQTSQQIISAEPGNRLGVLLRAIDPNQPQPLTLEQLQQLGKILANAKINQTETDPEIAQLVEGIQRGLKSWEKLAPDLVSWIYDQGRSTLGFEGTSAQRSPWAVWAKQLDPSWAKTLFQTIANNESVIDLTRQISAIQISDLIEVTVILQCLQRGLVTWFDRLIYDAKVGAKLSISTFLTFAVIWSQLANGFSQSAVTSERRLFSDACFQGTLQILRTFSQQSYFPLYGGIFALFGGEYLRNALSYLDEPLRQVEGTQEKARILTMLGYSLRSFGQYERAIQLHQEALEIAQTAGDSRCEIANLNHLSRSYLAEKNYEEAINTSQRALILARQGGDRLGLANALANYGYSQVFQAREMAEVDADIYESAIGYLEQGLKLSKNLTDLPGGAFTYRQTEALCASSLGIAYVLLEKPAEALKNLAIGLAAAQFSGDLYLQGLNYAYLAQAYWSLSQFDQGTLAGCLGMYLLEQIGSNEWRQPAALLTIVQGQSGAEGFQKLLQKQRGNIISVIGVDGYDYLLELLAKYQRSL